MAIDIAPGVIGTTDIARGPCPCSWTVRRPDGVVMLSGQAPGPASAQACAVFAAGAVQALARIARRRF